MNCLLYQLTAPTDKGIVSGLLTSITKSTLPFSVRDGPGDCFEMLHSDVTHVRFADNYVKISLQMIVAGNEAALQALNDTIRQSPVELRHVGPVDSATYSFQGPDYSRIRTEDWNQRLAPVKSCLPEIIITHHEMDAGLWKAARGAFMFAGPIRTILDAKRMPLQTMLGFAPQDEQMSFFNRAKTFYDPMSDAAVESGKIVQLDLPSRS